MKTLTNSLYLDKLKNLKSLTIVSPENSDILSNHINLPLIGSPNYLEIVTVIIHFNIFLIYILKILFFTNHLFYSLVWQDTINTYH